MKQTEPLFGTPIELLASRKLTHWKQKVHTRFLELGIPGNKTEQYKNFAIKPLLNRTYRYLRSKQGTVNNDENMLTIKDGVVITKPSCVDILFDPQNDIDMEHYDPLYYLGHLLSEHIIVLSVSCDADFTIAHHLNQEASLAAYRILISVAPDCRVNVHETFNTEASRETLLLYGLDVHVAQHARLTWVRNQTANAAEATVIGSHRYDLQANAELTLQSFDFGGGNALHLYKNELAEYTDTKISHLLFGKEKAHRGNILQLRHNGVHANSIHLAKSILKEQATGIFDGLIRVDQKAHHANVNQNSKAILLNDGAFMKAKPQLEIYTDELQASHGATTGQLDAAVLFYLSSRGVSMDNARKMLILAFANEMIEEVADKTAAQQIRDDFDSVYYQEKEIS